MRSGHPGHRRLCPRSFPHVSPAAPRAPCARTALPPLSPPAAPRLGPARQGQWHRMRTIRSKQQWVRRSNGHLQRRGRGGVSRNPPSRDKNTCLHCGAGAGAAPAHPKSGRGMPAPPRAHRACALPSLHYGSHSGTAIRAVLPHGCFLLVRKTLFFFFFEKMPSRTWPFTLPPVTRAVLGLSARCVCSPDLASAGWEFIQGS